LNASTPRSVPGARVGVAEEDEGAEFARKGLRVVLDGGGAKLVVAEYSCADDDDADFDPVRSGTRAFASQRTSTECKKDIP
jgi:hypothetical protein